MTDLANRSASILMWFDLPFWEIVIKSTLAIALAALTCQLLRRHSAALRHRVWVIGLAAALLVPFASLLLPRLLVPVLPPDAPTLAATQDMQPTIPINDANTSLPGTTHGSSANSVAPHAAADKDIPAVAADILLDKKIPVPHRICFWDTADGSLAHQIEVPAGLPKNCEVSPNGRHLVVALEDKGGIKLSGWRLDGREPVKEADGAPPAATRPR